MNLSLTRRRFLHGLGLGAGATLLSPLMRQVWAQSQGVMPRRVVFVVAGNGIETATFMTDAIRDAINAQGGSLSPDQRVNASMFYNHATPLEVASPMMASAPALGALAGDANNVDLTNKSAMLLGLSSLVTGGGHSARYGALSCSLANGKVPVAPTIESVLSHALAQETPFAALRLGVINGMEKTLHHGLTALEAKKSVPIIVNPTTAYNTLFGSVANAAGRQQFLNRTELLDYARVDVRRSLDALPSSSPERLKLENYIASIEELTRRQQLLLDAEDTLRRIDPGGPDVNPSYTHECPLVRLETQFELATTALLGGLTNVALLSSGTDDACMYMVYKSLEAIYKEDPNYRNMVIRHTICHESGSNPTYRKLVHTVTQRHVEMIAKMARTLHAVPEGDGTMLDHTAIVFLSDNGDDHHSSAREWPVLVLGGSKLGLKTDGRAIVYPRYDHDNNRQISNLFNTLGHASGAPIDDFGMEGATRKAKGPLSELFA